jgi:hypothetical protein
MECKVKSNKDACPCTAECERRGACCDCLRAHVARKSLPACLRGLDWIQVKK